MRLFVVLLYCLHAPTRRFSPAAVALQIIDTMRCVATISRRVAAPKCDFLSGC